jgi:hypothetical protein
VLRKLRTCTCVNLLATAIVLFTYLLKLGTVEYVPVEHDKFSNPAANGVEVERLLVGKCRIVVGGTGLTLFVPDQVRQKSKQQTAS